VYFALEVGGEVGLLPCSGERPEEGEEVIVDRAKIDGLIPCFVNEPESSLRKGSALFLDPRDILPLHESTPDCHCGPFGRRRLAEPVERQYAARPGIDGSQGTADQSPSPRTTYRLENILGDDERGN
jgi:hypothetical protein